jgi:hypothetical protein
VLLGLVVVSAALAWGGPFYASPAAQNVDSSASAVVGIDGTGNGFFVWKRFVGGWNIVEGRARSAAGALGAVQTLSSTGHDAIVRPHVGMASNGTAITVWQDDHGNASANTPIEARVRSSAGVLGPLLTISAKPGTNFAYPFANPYLAVNAAGDAACVWQGEDGVGKKHIYGRIRTAGGALGPVRMLSGIDSGSPDVAIDASGDATFVWTRNVGGLGGTNFIEARTLSNASLLGTLKTVGSGIAPSGGGALGTGSPAVDVDDAGDALVVWEQPDGSGPCGINGCPKIIARALSSGGVLAAPQGLSDTTSGGRNAQVAVDQDGDATAVWLVAGKVQARSRSKTGVLSAAPQDLVASGATNPLLLNGDPAGNTVAVWQAPNRVQARARTAGGVLKPTATFSVGAHTAYAGGVAVGANGKALVSWGQGDGTTQCSSSECWRAAGAAGP